MNQAIIGAKLPKSEGLLPDSLLVSFLDPISREKYVAKVHVEYPMEPMVCGLCKSLGHPNVACTKSQNKGWLQRSKVVRYGEPSKISEAATTSELHHQTL